MLKDFIFFFFLKFSLNLKRHEQKNPMWPLKIAGCQLDKKIKFLQNETILMSTVWRVSGF